MERNYYKAVNIETGEEMLTLIPPAVPVVSRQKLGEIIGGDMAAGFMAAVYGALHREDITKLAKGVITPEDYNLSMIEWLMTWEPDSNTTYNSDGSPKPQEASDGGDGDPLP